MINMHDVNIEDYYEDSEFEEVVTPTLIEYALAWVKEGWVQIKYTPQLSKTAVIKNVQQYTVDDVADHIGRDIGFFTDEDGETQLAISSASINWIKYIEDYEQDS
jgi:hypothetical protein